ncbi:hypothetical protein J6590_048110 [Homalodisca vitripennis]|nr:hypothetical protein J6590_048110 [Homalodisca vitripennis]
MSLSVAPVKNGKPHIIYNNYKYRESHVLKNGERAWRCLGRSCGATVMTNNDGTQILLSIEKHRGPHPVTMKMLTLTPTQRSSPTARTPVAESGTADAVVLSSVAPPALVVDDLLPTELLELYVATPASQNIFGLHTSPAGFPKEDASMALSAVSSAPSVCFSTPLTSHVSATLMAENANLKDEVTRLEEELKRVLDHSIESDIRLMQFTDQIFAPKSRLEVSKCAPTTDCALQCDFSESAICVKEYCSTIRSVVDSLRTTIEVKSYEWEGTTAENTWTTVVGGGRTISVSKRFEPLAIDSRELKSVQIKKRKNRKKKRKSGSQANCLAQVSTRTTPAVDTDSKESLSYPVIQIESDSHGCHLAGILGALVQPSAKVLGFFKPGAGLLTVGSGGTLSSGSCVILIAGTNDVADGSHKVIYEHLEGRLVNLLGSSSRIIVASLPHRHDLPPCHPINQRILLVNAYIEELCERHPRVDFFDFAGISRQHFTRHGMHLTFRGKKVLARLLLTCLRSDGGQKSTQAPRSLPPELDMLSPSPADLQTPPSEASNLQTPSRQQQTHSLMTEVPHVFLGTPFQGDEQS